MPRGVDASAAEKRLDSHQGQIQAHQGVVSQAACAVRAGFPEASTAQFPQGYRRAQGPTPPPDKGAGTKPVRYANTCRGTMTPRPLRNCIAPPCHVQQHGAGVAHTSETSGSRVQILARTDALHSLPETHRRLQVTHRFARSLAGVSVGAVRRLDSTLASSVDNCYRMSPKLLMKSVMSSRRFIVKLRPFSSGAIPMLRPFAPPITPSPFKLRRWLLGITA